MTEEDTYSKHPLFIAFREAAQKLSDVEEKTKEARILWETENAKNNDKTFLNLCSGKLYYNYNKCIEECLMASKRFDIAWRV